MNSNNRCQGGKGGMRDRHGKLIILHLPPTQHASNANNTNSTVIIISLRKEEGGRAQPFQQEDILFEVPSKSKDGK